MSRPTSERTAAKRLIDETIVQNLVIDDVATCQTAKGPAGVLPRSTFPIR
jgi:hypothetical protein